ncbi:CRISPR-associated endonuclease Cas2 [Methanosarcinales archaeon]|nr:MAG: CRISPR-associated endonuclease Cas2 [Methanosarcinales archaeon]
MKPGRHLYIVYEIKDNSTWNRLSRRLAYYGLRKVQQSVFNRIVILKDKEALIEEINGMDLGEEEKIHVIDLCERCRSEVIIIGKMPEARGHIVI